LVVDPFDLCDRYPRFCAYLLPCKKYPFLCTRDIVLPDKEGLIIEFSHELDKVIIPIDKICQYVLNCPGCGPSGYCPEYIMFFEGMPQPFELAVFESSGNMIVENVKEITSKTIQFTANKRLQYYLVVTPTKQTKFNVKYKLPLKIKANRMLR